MPFRQTSCSNEHSTKGDTMTLKQKILLLGAIPVLLMALVVNLSN